MVGDRNVLEEELERELKLGHPLYGTPMAAIARSEMIEDDILFEFMDGSGRVAAVHLTMAGEREKPPFPDYSVYPSFDNWRAHNQTMFLERAADDATDTVTAKFMTDCLNEWKGMPARLLELLLTSGSTVRLVLYDHARHRRLELNCISPTKALGPVEWEKSHVIVEHSDAHGVFNVIDREAGVMIANCGVEMEVFNIWYE